MPVDFGHGVGKPVDGFYFDAAVVDDARHHTPTGGPNIDGSDDASSHVQRKKAAATPASTGKCAPVVWLNSAEVIADTQLAT